MLSKRVKQTTLVRVPVGSKKITTTTQIVGNRRRRRRSRNNKKGLTFNLLGSGPVSEYIKVLGNPFLNPPVKTGVMTLSPTQLGTAYYKGVLQVPSGIDGLVLTLNPDAALVQSTVPSGYSGTSKLGYYMTVNWYTGSSFITANSSSFGASNTAVLGNNFSANRVVAAGLRASIAYPMTGVAPILMQGRFNGLTSQTSIDGLTPNFIYSEPTMESMAAQGGGSSVASTWLPSDPADFEFGPATGTTNGSLLFNPCVIAMSGLAGAMRIAVEGIVHIEGQAGADFGISESAVPQGETVMDYFPNVESLMRHSLPIVKELSQQLAFSPTIFTTLGATATALFHFRKFYSRGNRPTPLLISSGNLNDCPITMDEEKKELDDDSVLVEAQNLCDSISDLQSLEDSPGLARMRVDLQHLINQISRVVRLKE